MTPIGLQSGRGRRRGGISRFTFARIVEIDGYPVIRGADRTGGAGCAPRLLKLLQDQDGRTDWVLHASGVPGQGTAVMVER